MNTEPDLLREALLKLANAADHVGVAHFDSDDLSPEVEAMQTATLEARTLLATRLSAAHQPAEDEQEAVREGRLRSLAVHCLDDGSREVHVRSDDFDWLLQRLAICPIDGFDQQEIAKIIRREMQDNSIPATERSLRGAALIMAQLCEHPDDTLPPPAPTLNPEAVARVIDAEAFKTIRELAAVHGLDAANPPAGVLIMGDIDQPIANRQERRDEALAKARTIIAMAPPAADQPHAAVGKFLSELYAVMVDPCADGTLTVEQVKNELTAAALLQREALATLQADFNDCNEVRAHWKALAQSAEVERVGLDVILTGLVGSSRSQPSLTKLTLTYETEEQALAAHEAVTPPAAETEGEG